MKNNSPFIIYFTILVLTISSCSKNQHESNEEAVSIESLIFISEDGKYRFKVIPGDSNEINLKEELSGTSYDMKKVPVASGVKYEDDEGYYFWTKGENFMWGNNKETYATGSMINNATFDTDLFGNYVSSSYLDRKQRMDWIAVSIKKMDDYRARITVRSRADLKKPTCTYDAIATTMDNNTLKSFEDSHEVRFTLNRDTLTIDSDDENILYFFCSGGGSLAGEYIKIREDLDKTQIDTTKYQKAISYDDYLFLIRYSGNTLTIRPSGLEIDNRKVTHQIEGSIITAEAGDLNIDGYPEVLVYLQSDGSGSYGSIIGYSVNNGKSISQINLPDLSENPEASKGYMGHDEFGIVESNLVRRFPIYRDGDTNVQPTGGMRQIQYKLVEGEAMRQLVVDKVVEY